MKRYIFLFCCSTIFSANVACSQTPQTIGITIRAPDQGFVKQCRLPIAWSVNDGIDKTTYVAIKRAFDYWDNMTKKQLFRELGYTKVELASDADGQVANSPGYMMGLVSYAERPPDSTHVFAMTNMRWVDNGCMVGFQMHLYEQLGFVGERRFQANLRHEVGHVLGLYHSENPASLMYPISLPVEKPVISADAELLSSFYYLYGTNPEEPLRGTTEQMMQEAEDTFERMTKQAPEEPKTEE